MTRFSSRFSLALLMAVCLVSVSSAQDVAGPEGGRVFVKVTQNREIAGTPLDLVEIKVVTSFGEVAIPMAKIEGIKMHAGTDDSAVIAFKNGDLVTGKINLETIKLKTDWGIAHVNTSQIETVTVDRNARFVSDINGGTKAWRLSKSPAINSTLGLPPGR